MFWDGLDEKFFRIDAMFNLGSRRPILLVRADTGSELGGCRIGRASGVAGLEHMFDVGPVGSRTGALLPTRVFSAAAGGVNRRPA